MDGLDADEEWSDASEGAVKSGSATGELKANEATATHPRPPSAARLKSPSPLLTLSWQLKSTGSSDTGFGTGSSRVVVAPDAVQQKEKVAGLAQMYTDPGLTDAATDDDTVGDRLVTDDQPSDLDSLAAAKIDNRFKEIMSRKKGSPSPVSFLHKVSSPSFLSQQEPQFLSLVRLPTGYTTDNESIKTEDFESRFRSLLVTSDGNMVAEPEQASTPRLLGRGSKGKIPGTSTPRKSILSSRGAAKADATSKADVDKTGDGLKRETTVKWPEETARGPTASLATQSADSAPGNLLPG
ncbi:hypothetical protein C0Q70_08408 [Pomacea canaliculata]|uniref:Uncharacterized protein n=1 Tax=Pomacea canaliculata TaxID=400727 RepID=A0A2T7PHQ9_POMCA|nr:hypothetical protein C0Q70_08408 [Pomacea canaliculata]